MEKTTQQLKWAKYRRKSSEDDDRQAASLDSQDRELAEKAKYEGIDVLEKYNLAESHSAKRPGRPVFGELIALIEHGKVNALLVWHLNRISRNAIDTGIIIDLMDRGLLLEIRTPQYAFRNTPDNKFQLGLFCGIAKQENDSKGVDVVRGLKNKAIGGGRSGPAPLGYKNVTDERGLRTIVPDPERFPIIKKMWGLMLSGNHSVAKIMTMVNDDMGLRTPKRKNGSGAKKITKSLMYYILIRPFYYGEFEFPVGSGNHYKGTHVPMITREEYDRVQVLLGRKGRPRPQTRSFTYRGPIRCGECGGFVTAEEKHHCVCSNCKYKFSCAHTTACPQCKTDIGNMKNPVTRDYVFYHCTKRTHPNCTQGSINQDDLECQLKKELAQLEITPQFKDWALGVLKRQNAHESADREVIMKGQRKDYDAIVEKIDNLLDMRTGKEIDEDEYRRKKTTLLAEKARVYSLLGETDKRIENWIEVAERGFSFAETARERFNADTSEDLHVRKEIFATLGSNYTLMDKKLSIKADNLLFAIKRVKEESRVGIKAFEPTRKGSIATEIKPSYVLSPTLLPDLDSNQGEWIQSPLSYH